MCAWNACSHKRKQFLDLEECRSAPLVWQRTARFRVCQAPKKQFRRTRAKRHFFFLLQQQHVYTMAATGLLRLLLWFLCLFAIAQARLLQPVDVVSLPRPGAASTSPGGKLVVYSQSTYHPEEDKVGVKARHCYVRISRIIVDNNRQPKTCTWWTLTNLPSRSWRSLLSILLRATRSSSTNPTLRSFKPWKMNLWTSFMSWILLQRTKKLTSLLISLSSLLMSSECLPNYDCQLKLNLDMYINVPDITIRKAFLYFLPGCTTATIPLKIPNCVIWKSNRQSEAPAWFSTTSWSGK